MRAMILRRPGVPLDLVERPDPQPASGEVLLRVTACGVCRTDLHVVDGDLPEARLPIVPGHEIVGVVEALGAGVATFDIGQRVGVPWLGHTCGKCSYCAEKCENLCDHPVFTGYTRDGGFATKVIADAAFAFSLSDIAMPDEAVAPLLCAGLIGWRALRMVGNAGRLGLYGFGAAAHIISQIAAWQGREVLAFVRPGDSAGAAFARSCGVSWAGGSDEHPPAELDAAIIFAPVGSLVPQALKAVRKGGRVVCAGIHMSDVPAMPYRLLWGERQLLSVANLTRRDGEEFFDVVKQARPRTHTTAFRLAQANEALSALRSGTIEGAAVIVPD